jgi:hypothetical protein
LEDHENNALVVNVESCTSLREQPKTNDDDVTTGPTALPPYKTRFADPNDEVMAEVMENKLKPKRKEPLSKRIETFFEAVQVYKRGQQDEEEFFNAARIVREWTMRTKGVDAALAESSDDEDNNMHTI